MGNKYVKRRPMSVVIRNVNENRITAHFATIRLAQVRKSENRKCGQTGILMHSSWECEGTTSEERSVVVLCNEQWMPIMKYYIAEVTI